MQEIIEVFCDTHAHLEQRTLYNDEFILGLCEKAVYKIPPQHCSWYWSYTPGIIARTDTNPKGYKALNIFIEQTVTKKPK